MIRYFSYYTTFSAMPRPLVKVVAALCRALTHGSLLVYSLFDPIIISIRLKPFSLIYITLTAGECRPQDCNASLYAKNLCVSHCRADLNGLSGLPAKINNLK